MVRRGVGVDRPDECLLDTSARVGLGLEDVVESFIADAFDLGDRETRLEEDLGDKIERGAEAGSRHVDRDRQGVPPGVRMERCAESFARFDQFDGVTACGALGQRPAGQHRRAGLVGGLLGGAAGHDQRGGDERAPRQVHDDDRQAVREGVGRDGREFIRTRAAGLWPL